MYLASEGAKCGLSQCGRPSTSVFHRANISSSTEPERREHVMGFEQPWSSSLSKMLTVTCARSSQGERTKVGGGLEDKRRWGRWNVKHGNPLPLLSLSIRNTTYGSTLHARLLGHAPCTFKVGLYSHRSASVGSAKREHVSLTTKLCGITHAFLRPLGNEPRYGCRPKRQGNGSMLAQKGEVSTSRLRLG